jgi:alpha-galactosidase
MNRPEQQDGIILAFRRSGCENESIRIKPRGLEGESSYELFYEDYNFRIRKSGKEIMEGIDLTIPQRQASLLIRYHLIAKQ